MLSFSLAETPITRGPQTRQGQTTRHAYTSAVCGVLATIHGKLLRAKRPLIAGDLTKEQLENNKAKVQKLSAEGRQGLEKLLNELLQTAKAIDDLDSD